MNYYTKKKKKVNINKIINRKYIDIINFLLFQYQKYDLWLVMIKSISILFGINFFFILFRITHLQISLNGNLFTLQPPILYTDRLL